MDLALIGYYRIRECISYNRVTSPPVSDGLHVLSIEEDWSALLERILAAHHRGRQARLRVNGEIASEERDLVSRGARLALIRLVYSEVASCLLGDIVQGVGRGHFIEGSRGSWLGHHAGHARRLWGLAGGLATGS